MDGFLLDCSFNAGYEGLKFRELTPHYANQLRAMLHSAESIRQNFDTDSALCSTAQS
jgi:hypothetical protein